MAICILLNPEHLSVNSKGLYEPIREKVLLWAFLQNFHFQAVIS